MCFPSLEKNIQHSHSCIFDLTLLYLPKILFSYFFFYLMLQYVQKWIIFNESEINVGEVSFVLHFIKLLLLHIKWWSNTSYLCKTFIEDINWKKKWNGGWKIRYFTCCFLKGKLEKLISYFKNFVEYESVRSFKTCKSIKVTCILFFKTLNRDEALTKG